MIAASSLKLTETSVKLMASLPTVKRSHQRSSNLFESVTVKDAYKLNLTRKPKLQTAARKANLTHSAISTSLDNALLEAKRTQDTSLDQTPSLEIKRILKPLDVPSIQLAHKRAFTVFDRPQTVKHKRRLTQKEVAPDNSRVRKRILGASSASIEGTCKGMPGKSNQDCVIECQEIGPDTWFVAICDGHGVAGGEIARFIAAALSQEVATQVRQVSSQKRALVHSIESVIQRLLDSELDYRFSGTTLVALLATPKEAICANLGDSRALIGGTLENKYKSFHLPMSRDHKPELADEACRIKEAGGRIEAFKDERGQPIGPLRVWLKKLQIPGLALSRTIGDSVACTVGVSNEPEVIVHSWRPQDNFIVLGSDGLFEYLSNTAITQLVRPWYSLQDSRGACDCLVKEARSRWEIGDEVIDDISVAVVFLQ